MLAKLQAGKNKEWLLGAALLALTCLVYQPMLHAGFVWDDVFMVTDNRMLRDQHGLHTLWFTNKFADPYRITMTSFWLEWQIWQSKALGYHLVSVLTHGIGALLLWRVLRRLALPGAWLAAVVFAVHPICVASAGWISEQKNTCSLIFYLLTFLWYLRFENSGQQKWYWLALFIFVCALMSKGSVVMLPVVLLALAWWQRSRITRKDFLRIIPFFALSFGAGLVTIWFQNHKAIGGEMVQGLDFFGRLAGAAWAVWFYLWKDWMPLNLSVIYPQWQIDSHSILAYVPGVLLCATLAACWHFRKSWGRHVLFGLGYFVITLFPVMGFFNMYILVFSRVFDHWQYAALPGSIALAVCGGTFLFKQAAAKFHFSNFIGSILAGALIIFLSISTMIRAEVYTSEETLWRDTVEKNPQAWMAFNNLGNALGAAGKTDEAMQAYNAAIKINPDFPDAHSNLGNALVGQKKLDEAIEHFKKAIKGEPRMANFHFNYGIALFEKKQFKEAAEEYGTALRLQPNSADALNNMANLLNKENKFQEALGYALNALQLRPDSSEAHYNAATAFSGLDKNAEAISHLEAALKLRPDFAGAHYDLGIAFAMENKMEEAARHFREVIRLKPDDASGHSSLGNALASIKKLDEAVAEYKIALRILPDDAQTHHNLATALSEQGKLDEAIEHYRISVNSRGDDPDTHFNFGMALARQGKVAEALAQYKEALRLKPGDAKIQDQIRVLSSRKN